MVMILPPIYCFTHYSCYELLRCNGRPVSSHLEQRKLPRNPGYFNLITGSRQFNHFNYMSRYTGMRVQEDCSWCSSSIYLLMYVYILDFECKTSTILCDFYNTSCCYISWCSSSIYLLMVFVICLILFSICIVVLFWYKSFTSLKIFRIVL